MCDLQETHKWSNLYITLVPKRKKQTNKQTIDTIKYARLFKQVKATRLIKVTTTKLTETHK